MGGGERVKRCGNRETGARWWMGGHIAANTPFPYSIGAAPLNKKEGKGSLIYEIEDWRARLSDSEYSSLWTKFARLPCQRNNNNNNNYSMWLRLVVWWNPDHVPDHGWLHLKIFLFIYPCLHNTKVLLPRHIQVQYACFRHGQAEDVYQCSQCEVLALIRMHINCPDASAYRFYTKWRTTCKARA